MGTSLVWPLPATSVLEVLIGLGFPLGGCLSSSVPMGSSEVAYVVTEVVLCLVHVDWTSPTEMWKQDCSRLATPTTPCLASRVYISKTFSAQRTLAMVFTTGRRGQPLYSFFLPSVLTEAFGNVRGCHSSSWYHVFAYDWTSHLWNSPIYLSSFMQGFIVTCRCWSV